MAEIKNCVVGSGGHIQEGCYIPKGCVLGDNVRVESGLKMADATRVEPDTYLS
jgi:UDP-3-O-[3-hydroxymyristoyl] glucosamine N-acyltransferase